MKKFLTVLLVIAVMFTFSFGSAFALTDAETNDARAYVDQAMATFMDGDFEDAVTKFMAPGSVDFDKDGYLTAVNNTSVSGSQAAYVTKEVVLAAANAAKAKAINKFVGDVATYKASVPTTDKAIIFNAVKGAFNNSINAEMSTNAILGSSYATVIANQIKANKEAAKEILATDTSVYSDNTNDWSVVLSISPGRIPGKLLTDKIGDAASPSFGEVTGYADYSTFPTEKDPADPSVDVRVLRLSAKAYVETVLAAQSAAINSASATLAGQATAMEYLTVVLKGHKIGGDYGNYYVAAVPTMDELKADTSLDAAKAYKIAQMKADLAQAEVSLTKNLDDAIAAYAKKATLNSVEKADYAALQELKANFAGYFDAAEEVYAARVNYCTTVNAVNNVAVAVPATYAAVKTQYGDFVTYVNWVKDIQAEGELLANMKDVNGQPYYDEAVLKANVEDAVEAIYKGEIARYSDALAMIDGNAEGMLIDTKIAYINFISGKLAATSTFTTKDSKGRTLTVADQWNKVYADPKAASYNIAVMVGNDTTPYAANEYYLYDRAQRNELKALVAETKAAITDAKTVAEVKDIFVAAQDKYTAIPTTDDHAKAWNGKLGVAYSTAKYDDELKAYAQYALSTKYSDPTKYTGATNSVDKILDTVAYPVVYEAYTVDELAGKIADAKAEIDGILTIDQLKAKRTEVEDAIKALPEAKNVTLADKDAITDAADALYYDYEYIPGCEYYLVTNETKLTAAINAYEALAAKELDAAFKALDDKVITPADKDAVKALRDLYDAYDDFCSDYYGEPARTATTNNNAATDLNSVKKLEAELSDALVAEAKALMIKLPANPTAKDRAQVEAARAAYEALTLAEKAQLVNSPAYDNLIDAEEALEVLSVYAVQALKVKASSTAAKGSITVKWSVTGDAAAADGYQIWRSTKKNSGFKKMFTTTKTSYKNTKGLKKGTRYYYKVRAYVAVDGQNIYSDWSNKAYRVAK